MPAWPIVCFLLRNCRGGRARGKVEDDGVPALFTPRIRQRAERRSHDMDRARPSRDAPHRSVTPTARSGHAPLLSQAVLKLNPHGRQT